MDGTGEHPEPERKPPPLIVSISSASTPPNRRILRSKHTGPSPIDGTRKRKRFPPLPTGSRNRFAPTADRPSALPRKGDTTSDPDRPTIAERREDKTHRRHTPATGRAIRLAPPSGSHEIPPSAPAPNAPVFAQEDGDNGARDQTDRSRFTADDPFHPIKSRSQTQEAGGGQRIRTVRDPVHRKPSDALALFGGHRKIRLREHVHRRAGRASVAKIRLQNDGERASSFRR